VAAIVPSWRNRHLVFGLQLAVGTGFLVWALWPVLAVPLHADDFLLYAFWAEGRLRGPWWGNLAPHELFVGPRVVPAGLAALWLWLEATFRLGEWTGIPIDLVWRLWRLVLPVLAVGAGAAFGAVWGMDSWRVPARWRTSAERAPSPGGSSLEAFGRVYLAGALVLGAVVQVHMLWSNDPVTAFGLAGWGTTILLFLYLAVLPAALTRSGRAGWIWLATGTVLGIIGVWYYEMLLLPVVIAAAIAAVVAGKSWRSRGWPAARAIALRGAAVAFVPAFIFIATRVMIGSNLTGDQDYEGTAFRLGGQFAGTWFAASASALPGSAWSLSSTYVGPFWGSDHVGLASVMVTLALVALGALLLRLRPDGEDRGSSNDAGGPHRPWGLGPGSAAAVLVALWIGAAGLHSATGKYQDEMAGVLGKVYLYYAPAAVAVALILGSAILWLARFRSWVPLACIAVPLLVVATQQLAANRLIAVMGTATYRGEQLAIQAYQDGRPGAQADAERCAALKAWRTNLRWPRVDQERYLQDAYELTRGFPMCRADVP
jgi:hypothetical protein